MLQQKPSNTIPLQPDLELFEYLIMSNGDQERHDDSSQEIESSPMLPKIIKFDSLARCGDEIWIENNGQIYRLRRTKQGKLILTK